MNKAAFFLAVLALAACKEDVAKAPPPPVELNSAALSFFCQMNVLEHGGPKGQIHLEGYPAPLFFAQVRDLVAYLKSPERDARITAVYVSDMGQAASWDDLGQNNWILAEDAQFIIGANVAGGMGAPEIVPFGDAISAAPFLNKYGGQLLPFTEIPDDAALAPVDLSQPLETPS
jgi:copper chaperone NosL